MFDILTHKWFSAIIERSKRMERYYMDKALEYAEYINAQRKQKNEGINRNGIFPHLLYYHFPNLTKMIPFSYIHENG